MKEHFQSATSTTVINSTCSAESLTDADIETLYSIPGGKQGILTADFVTSSYYDAEKNKFKTSTDLATFVASRIGPSYLKTRANVNNQPATGGVGSTEFVRDNLGQLIEDDKQLFRDLKNEYCHYQSRYNYVLGKFLTSITTSGQSATVPGYLTKTILLNRRLNALLEIMDYLGRQRVDYVNAQSALIDATGDQISKDMGTLQSQAEALNGKKAILETQQEMMRFTLEKNNNIRNQISLWASLNIMALGVIFYVYRQI